MATEMLSHSGTQIRENLVTTAVKFLNNPNVQRCTIESKERFLRGKGLTDPEIQKAIEKTAEMLDLPSMTSEIMMFQSKRNLLRDHVVPLLVYGGIAYSCYWFYKTCIRHLLFIEQPKRKSTSECVDELRKSLDVLNANVTSLRGEMHTANQQTAARSQLSDLQADIASVKGILLNRNQFPTLKSRTTAASIPSWQLGDAEEPMRPRSRRSESGGSNSSENEHAAKNSDSSLEIMEREDSTDKTTPLSAWDMWYKNLRRQYPNLKSTEINKLGREIWLAVDKTPWEQKAAAANERYKRQEAHDAYNKPERKQHSDTSSDEIIKQSIITKPKTGYMMWLDAERDNIEAQHPGLKVTELAHLKRKIWRSVDQTPWEQKSAAAKEEYKKQIEAYDAYNKPE